MHCTTARRQPAVRKRPPVKPTILVIEDESFVRGVTCEVLRHAGYRVMGAESAVAARNIFQRHQKQIQLLFCDAVLPDASGALLSQTLRRLSPGLKVILVSGYPNRGLSEFDQHANAFLAKPYCADALLAVVQMALPAKASARRNQARGM
jgi:two-component system cell cycle sensor histidine kinase/response regulator CckA